MHCEVLILRSVGITIFQLLPIVIARKRFMLKLLGIAASFCVLASSLGLVSQSQGNAVDPFRSATNRAVVLIFVRTDCPVSNRYAPEIQRIAAKYANQSEFWLVFPSRNDTAENIEKYLHEFGYTRISALRDPSRDLVKKARAAITPEAAVFDAQHKLVYHGRIDNWYEEFGRARAKATTHELDDTLSALAGGRQVATSSMPAVGCYISDLP
jgi:thiol-disulfide isomerase/thioredoxin